MRRLILFAMFLSQLALAVGTVTVTRSYIDYYKVSAPKSVELVKFAWTGDSSNGTVPATSVWLTGQVLKAIVIPGTTNPSTNYNVTLIDALDTNNGLDALGSALAGLSASATQAFTPKVFLAGSYKFTITSQSVASATGTVYLYLTDQSTVASTSSGGGGGVTGPGSSTTNDLASFADSSGGVIKDSGLLTSNVVTLAGTQTLTNKTLTSPTVNGATWGGTTATGQGNTKVLASDGSGNLTALTETGTGNAVLGTGPTLSNPVVGTQGASDNSTKAASTAYVTTAVANGIAGVNPAVAVMAATTAAGDTSGLTYANGVAGIGATFTGSVNTALTFDGQTLTSVNQRVLVKNDTQSPSGAFNGVYYLTQLQTGILPPILTRTLDFDQSTDINSTGAIPVTSGTVNGSTSWVVTSTVNTVGTDPVTFTKFSLNPTTILTNTLNSANLFVGNGSNVATGVALTGDISITNAGVSSVAKINGTTVSGTTGSTNVAFSASPTFTGTAVFASATFSGSMKNGNCIVSPSETDIGNSGASQSVDLSTANVFTSTLTANSTFTFSNPVNGCPYVFILTQDGTGSRTLTTAGVTVIWGATGTKTLSTAANAVDKVSCVYYGNSVNKLLCDLGVAYQ